MRNEGKPGKPIITRRELYKKIESLEKENAELKAQVTELTHFKDAVKGNYTEKSDGFIMLMEALINLFKQNKIENFITLTLTHKKNKYAITIEDCTKGKTPQEKIEELNKNLEEAERALKLACEAIKHVNDSAHLASCLSPYNYTLQYYIDKYKSKARR